MLLNRGWMGWLIWGLLSLGMWWECRKLGWLGMGLGGWVGFLGMELWG